MQVYNNEVFEDGKVTANELASVIQHRLQGKLSLRINTKHTHNNLRLHCKSCKTRQTRHAMKHHRKNLL